MRVVFACGWAIAVIAGLLLAVTPTYKVNDNAGILSMIQEGAEAPFMSPVFVELLTFLYRDVSPSVPWFGIANYLALFWAIALFVHALSALRIPRGLSIPLDIVFSALCATFAIRVGYNASSILLGGVSLLAFVAYLRSHRLSKAALLVCALGLVFAFLFRPRGAQGAVVVVGPALLAMGLLARRRFAVGVVLAFVLPISVVGAVHVVWKTTFVSDEYRAFREFNQVRGKFHAYPIARANLENVRLFEANDWLAYHYILLKDWLYFDEDVWNLEKLRNIFEYSVPLPEDEIDAGTIASAFQELWSEQYARYLTLLPLLVVVFLACRSRRVAIWAAGYALYMLVLSVYLSIAYRLPDRVGDPMFVLGFASMVWLFVGVDRIRPLRIRAPLRRATGVLFALACVCPVVVFAVDNARDAAKWGERNAKFERQHADFNKWFKGRILFPQAIVLSTQAQNPLRNYEFLYEVVPSGWRTYSPQFYDCLRRHGLSRGSELIPFAIDNLDFFFAWRRDYVDVLYEFVKRQYGVRFMLRAYEGLSTQRYVIFQLVTDPEPDSNLSVYHRQVVTTPFDRRQVGGAIGGDELDDVDESGK
ncbi:MAG: hypothetical protein KDB80_04570 [Planctomycetes bacterium]|nr:hypothetical protein [Planctomycetota bacterium]